MKITEDTINHCAVQSVKEITDFAYELNGDSKEDQAAVLIAIGEIRGIITMVDALKEALKA